jgi:hypothetical protein
MLSLITRCLVTNSVFWVLTLCSLQRVSISEEHMASIVEVEVEADVKMIESACCLLLLHVPPKRRDLSKLHGITIQ